MTFLPIVERELRVALRDLRAAIDKYKDACDKGTLGTAKNGTECYPETLEVLVEGVKIANDAKGKKIKFLRSIPLDPMTNTRDWGFRSMQDEPNSQSWGRQNIQKDDEIVVTWLEHHANIVPWQMLAQQTGAVLKVAPVDDRGNLLMLERRARWRGIEWRLHASGLGDEDAGRDAALVAHPAQLFRNADERHAQLVDRALEGVGRGGEREGHGVSGSRGFSRGDGRRRGA